MAQSYVITSFATGEISRKFEGRIDLPQYVSGCKVMQNIFPHPTGGAEKRPGTMYANTAAGKCLLIPWIKSESEYLILELSAAKIRFYSYNFTTQKASLVMNGASVVEVSLAAASWIAEANLPDVKYVQDSVTTIYDTMYFACPGFTLRQLVRTSDTSWTFGAASLTGYSGTNASTCELFEDRLILTENNVLYGSKTADHLVFSAASPAVAEDGFSFITAAKENSVILWTAASDTLLYGTASNVFRVAGKNDVLSGETLAIWPSKQAAIGCSKVQPVIYNEYLVFVQRGGKRLHIVVYSQDADLYQANDVTFYSDHITGSGVVQLAFQRNPEPILWAVTSDGDLISMVYSHTTQTVGWSKHDLGGTVESICVIQTTGEDVLAVSLLREINGSSVRYVETLTKRDWSGIADAHFVDSGIIVDYGAAVTVTGITAGDEGAGTASVCTAPSHGFDNDELVRFSLIAGEVYTVKNKAANTFDLYTRDGSSKVYIGEALTGGTVEQVSNIVTGLSHLEGETVQVLGDGSVIASEEVSSGQITIDEYANHIHVGLSYTAILEPNNIAINNYKLKRIVEAYAKFLNTVSVKIGKDTTHLKTFDLAEGAPIMGDPPTLTTGNLLANFPADFKDNPTMVIVSDLPLPMTVLNIAAEVET